jgi:hypothetical protein
MPDAKDGSSAPTDRQIVEVHRASGGWTLSNVLLGDALTLLSRRKAEDHAKALPGRLTRLGFDSRVDLHDQHVVPVGSIWWGDSKPSRGPQGRRCVGRDRPVA